MAALANRFERATKHLTVRVIGVVLALFAAVAAAATAQGAATTGAQRPAPAEHFTRQATLSGAELSPSGQRLALLQRADGGRTVLVVRDLASGDAKLVAGFGDADVTSVRWVNDDRLVYEAYQDGPVVARNGAGTFACDHDGANARQLIAWRYANRETGTSITSRTLPYGWFLHSTLDDGSDDVFVHRVVRDALGDVKQSQLARLGTRTGELRTLSDGMPEYVGRWLLDAKGEPRVVSAYRDGRSKVFWRDPADAVWKPIGDFDSLKGDGFVPRHVAADGRLIVSAAVRRDTAAYYAFDPATRRLGDEPLVAVQGFDLDAALETDSRTRELVGLHFVADRPVSYWFDDRLQAVQRSLDAALPGRFNRIGCGRCASTTTFLVRSSSDRQPGEYFVFDAKKASLQKIGAVRPWIDEATQGRRSFHRVATRDGVSMPVVVTHPPQAKDAAPAPAPAVVIVHGGPWVRGGDLSWNAEAQYFASRGYRVIEPEFRGSTGFGFRHVELSFKQWGGTMQDDLVDAVRWAAREGLVDAGRVCVMGGSYGGYAALMAPIHDPGVFRCAISFAGVTDLDALYTMHWSDFSEQHKTHGLPTLVGDRAEDAALLARASPLRRAAEIKVPVLLAHGAQDRRVPVEHAQTFADSARRAGVDIDVVTYPDEGHGWSWSKHHADFLRRADKLLQRALAPAP